MSSGTETPGQALGALGGFGLAASLWLPWYTIHIPQSALLSLNQASQQWGALGGLVRSGAALLSQLGPFHITAWHALSTIPAVLLAAAIIGGGLALLALTDRAGSTSQLTMLAGFVGAVLVGYRVAVPPGQSSFVSPAWGSYLALLSSLAMLAGGFLAGRSGAAAVPVAMTPQPAPWPTAPAATGWDAASAPTMSVATESAFGAPVAPATPHAPATATDFRSAGESVPPPGV